RHVKRVCHVHCKDVRPAVVAAAWNRQWSFLTSVLNGAFTVPGDGAIDFAGVLDVLAAADYRGWLVVEAEQDPTVAPSFTFASKGYRHLRGLADARTGALQ
ncbi:MAG: myo-inosose-2 dehydratase, partial [Proteobacteria bacterium]|nr:myo-inosose-2 dehydratase [Pseudomonadota bacterium]